MAERGPNGAAVQAPPKKLKKVFKGLLAGSILAPTVLCVLMLTGMYDPASFNPNIRDILPDAADAAICTVVAMLAFFGVVFVSQLEAID